MMAASDSRISTASSRMSTQEPQTGNAGNRIALAYKYVMTNKNGLEINQLITKPKLIDRENKIQILTIGKENNKPTKSFLLIGQTGDGKTTLLNGMINYIMGTKFEDKSRFSIRDETGSEMKNSTQSQTEFVTAYLIYHHPGMATDCNFMIIDTPGFVDTRGEEQQTKIRMQMEKFLKDDKFEFNELHCLGFVINGTINRAHTYLRRIVQDFESLFGKDTVNITKILATHVDDEAPAASQVLEDLDLKSDKLYTFDNGVLSVSNQGKGTKIDKRRLSWGILEDQYRDFFSDMMVAEPGSLKLSKQAIAEKMRLERSLLMLKRQIDHRVRVLLQCNSKKRLYEKYNNCMRSNQVFEGEEKFTVKERVKIQGRFTHAHNCPSCEQTCVYPCTTMKYAFCSCPSGDKACEVCPCSKASHNSEYETIESRLETRKVTDFMMKSKYEEAKHKMQSEEQMILKLEQDAAHYTNQMATFIKQTLKHISSINEIARNPNPKVSEELLFNILEDIRDTIAREITDPLDKQYMKEILTDLPAQVDRIVLQETNQKLSLKEKLLKKMKDF